MEVLAANAKAKRGQLQIEVRYGPNAPPPLSTLDDVLAERDELDLE